MRPLFTLFALLLIHQTAGAQLISGEQVVIDERVDHDLYLAGGTVTINAPVHGDLVVAGGTIIVNDTVTQDILVAGGNIQLNSFVGDDIRCGGGTIQVRGPVTGDLVITGGRIAIGKPSVIAGSLVSSGGQVTVDGTVKGNITDASGAFTLNGTAAHDLDCRGGTIAINGNVQGASILAADVIAIGETAKFKGDVRYWNGEGALDFRNSLQGTKAIYDSELHLDSGQWQFLGFASVLMLLWYLSASLVMILVLQYLFSRTLRNAANTVKEASLKSLGVGVVYLVVVPVAIVILFATVIGVLIGVLVTITYVTVLLVATVVVCLVISNWINNTYYGSRWRNNKIAFVGFGIFICLKLASLTPFVGPPIMLLLICMAFGGILLNVKWKKNVPPVSMASPQTN